MTRPEPLPVGPGQESAWDYPRPPRVEQSTERVEVVLGGAVIAGTSSSLRVLETSHPPTYYLPRDAFVNGSLRPCRGSSWCEWKGTARYFDLISGDVVAPRAGWTYPDPSPGFAPLRDHVAVMPGLVDACLVDGEKVVPQQGGFYGGWITSRVVGPFKGGPGTQGW
ncbi:DUF427 domain-containing protein [Microlunatus panaciterrae]|uniref:Uncharacterized protein (DUF427 family) n=1 Tax=Microlunatus panaciterrae TaxID=400768 RepID=A0ABS2RJG8_9ACTN|nr:uncharacterized protein (DUF427 family) [Microlunatus panaciterrae]